MESELVLTPQFFKHTAEAPNPIDLNVLRELNKPRAIDMYIWLTLKQYWLAKPPRRLHLHLGHDRRQFRNLRDNLYDSDARLQTTHKGSNRRSFKGMAELGN